ncbi:hypothetical protein FOA52_010420 [Chlamydomonas sp. UWO 241]|nr:hypothetical protein FOA52_010420 [Chlamydomonas sp. UWO 241]
MKETLPCDSSCSTHQRDTHTGGAVQPHDPAVDTNLKACVTAVVSCGEDIMRKMRGTANSMTFKKQNRVKPDDAMMPSGGPMHVIKKNKETGEDYLQYYFHSPNGRDRVYAAGIIPMARNDAGEAFMLVLAERWLGAEYKSRPDELALAGGKVDQGDATSKHTSMREGGEETGGNTCAAIGDVVASWRPKLLGPVHVAAAGYDAFICPCELAELTGLCKVYADVYKGEPSHAIDKGRFTDYTRMATRLVVMKITSNSAGCEIVGDHFDERGNRIVVHPMLKLFLETFRPQDFATPTADLAPPSVRAPPADVTEACLGTRSAPPLGRTQASTSGANPFAELEFYFEDN